MSYTCCSIAFMWLSMACDQTPTGSSWWSMIHRNLNQLRCFSQLINDRILQITHLTNRSRPLHACLSLPNTHKHACLISHLSLPSSTAGDSWKNNAHIYSLSTYNWNWMWCSPVGQTPERETAWEKATTAAVTLPVDHFPSVQADQQPNTTTKNLLPDLAETHVARHWQALEQTIGKLLNLWNITCKQGCKVYYSKVFDFIPPLLLTSVISYLFLPVAVLFYFPEGLYSMHLDS